jgi:hypothetical protein
MDRRVPRAIATSQPVVMRRHRELYIADPTTLRPITMEPSGDPIPIADSRLATQLPHNLSGEQAGSPTKDVGGTFLSWIAPERALIPTRRGAFGCAAMASRGKVADVAMPLKGSRASIVYRKEA